MAMNEWSPIQLPQILKVVYPRDFGVATVDELEISRGPDLSLRISLQGDGGFTRDAVKVPGTEWKPSPISLLTQSSQSCTLHHYRSREGSTRTENGRTRTQVVGGAASLSIAFGHGAPLSIVEWLTNVPELIWTRFTERTEPLTTIQREESNAPGGHARIANVSCDHIALQFQLPTLSMIRIGTVPPKFVTEGLPIDRPGFIEYHPGPQGLPDERLRHVARRAFEFLFGGGLGLLGYSELDHSGQPVQVFMNSPYVPGGFGGALPPALLHKYWRNGLDEELVARLVRRFVELESDYDLDRAVWLCLHARNAPLEMAAGYVGAAFEILRRGYYKRPENESRSRLLPSSQWSAVAKRVSEAIDSSMEFECCKSFRNELDDLKSRFSGLNDVSGSRLNRLFLSDLGLKFGDTEEMALAARNDAAHANRVDPSENFASLRAYRAAHTLFARGLLTILGGYVRYFDYSTFGFPVRDLSEAQGTD